MKNLSEHPDLALTVPIGETVLVENQQFTVEEYDSKVFLTSVDSRVKAYNDLVLLNDVYPSYSEYIRHVRRSDNAAMMTRRELRNTLADRSYTIDQFPCPGLPFSSTIAESEDEQLSSDDKVALLTLVHDAMDEAGKVNDDERLKELSHIARKLGDGNESSAR